MSHEKYDISFFYHYILYAVKLHLAVKKNKCEEEELENDISSDLYQKLKKSKREFRPRPFNR